MASSDDFYHLSAERLIHKDDPDFEYKLLRLGQLPTDNPVDRARILLDRADRIASLGQNSPAGLGPYQREIRTLRSEAKDLYLQALRHKESTHIHEKLAGLLSLQEARTQFSRYKDYPNIREVYRHRLTTLGTHAFIWPSGKWPLAAGGLVVALLLGWGIWAWLHHPLVLHRPGQAATTLTDTKRTDTNITRNYTNIITFVDTIPAGPFDGVVAVTGGSMGDTSAGDTVANDGNHGLTTSMTSENSTTSPVLIPPSSTSPTSTTAMISPRSISPRAIAEQVNRSRIPVGQQYVIKVGGQAVGYATNSGNNHYDIRLLNTFSQGMTSTSTSTSPQQEKSISLTRGIRGTITPYQLNAARTAYTYYLSTHQDTPPTSLQAIKSMVPGHVPLANIAYTPSTDPRQALTAPGASVPFAEPLVTIDLSKRQLTVTYNGQKLLSSLVGIGSPSQPTPTGTFTVTDRMPNTLSPVYGDYILPLNNSSFAIHGTNQPQKIGETRSLGCIETPNKVDDELYRLLPVGTPVVIRSSQNSGTTSPKVFR